MSDATQWTALLLEKQKMQAAAEEEKNEGIRRALTSTGQNIMGGLSALNSSMRQQKLDDIANSLMNEAEAIPRATVDDPAAQKAADAKAAKMPGFHTGGTDEMKLMLAMDDQKLQRMAMSLRQQEAGEAQADARSRPRTWCGRLLVNGICDLDRAHCRVIIATRNSFGNSLQPSSSESGPK